MPSNHFVPRFILRNFAEKISVYNLKDKKLEKNVSIKKAFTETGIYSEELEKMLNELIENKAATTLRNKILSPDTKILIDRVELNILRKFLLVEMFRTMWIQGLEPGFIDHYRAVATIHPCNFHEKESLKLLSPNEYWEASLKCILECSDVLDIKAHPEATALAVCFAEGYNSAYMGIWDSSECGEEFIIMDQGMTLEHEKAPREYMYKDAMKRGYLLNRMEQLGKSNPQSIPYAKIFSTNNLFHENFYFHTISKNRIIVLINPFFELYEVKDENVDIWPTSISYFEKNLVAKNKVQYETNGKISSNDIFSYEVKQLKLREAIYINTLTLDRIHNIVGCTDFNNIKRSIYTYQMIPSLAKQLDLTDLFNRVIAESNDILEKDKITLANYAFTFYHKLLSQRELTFIIIILKLVEDIS